MGEALVCAAKAADGEHLGTGLHEVGLLAAHPNGRCFPSAPPQYGAAPPELQRMAAALVDRNFGADHEQ